MHWVYCFFFCLTLSTSVGTSFNGLAIIGAAQRTVGRTSPTGINIGARAKVAIPSKGRPCCIVRARQCLLRSTCRNKGRRHGGEGRGRNSGRTSRRTSRSKRAVTGGVVAGSTSYGTGFTGKASIVTLPLARAARVRVESCTIDNIIVAAQKEPS